MLFPQAGEDEYDHICALVDFALAMKQSLDEVNKHSFNNFQLRVGQYNVFFYIVSNLVIIKLSVFSSV